MSYSYDEFGRVLQENSSHTFNEISSSSSVTVNSYHQNGVRSLVTISADGTPHLINGYEIDSRGRIEGLTQHIQSAFTHWASSTVPKNKAVAIDYNSNNTREQLDRIETADITGQSLSHTTYGYLDDGNLESLKHRRPTESGSTNLAQYIYRYDSAGRISGIDSFFYEGSGASSVLHFDELKTSYNRRSELQNVGPNNLGGDIESVMLENVVNDASYLRDNNANIVGQNEEVGRLNRLYVDAEDHSYTYDNEGRLLSEQLDTGTTSRVYTWDHRGLLATRSALGVTQEFYYDVLGRKVARQTPTKNQAYIRDGAMLALEMELSASAAPQVTRNYFNGPGVNEVLAIDQLFDTDEIDTVWLFADQQGTARTVGRHSGGSSPAAEWEVLHRNYDQVGNTSFDFSGKDVNVLGDTTSEVLDETPIYFAGHQGHKLLRLYDTGSRWYDPRSQRYFSEDPNGLLTG